HRVGRHTATRGPAEERRGAWHLQVIADLRRADRRVRKGDVEAMQEEKRVRRLTAVACSLHRLADVREEGIPLLPLHALEPQAVVAQADPQQTSPEACAGLAEAVRLRHIYLHTAMGDARVLLASEATALRRWLAVGAEPHGIDHASGVG